MRTSSPQSRAAVGAAFSQWQTCTLLGRETTDLFLPAEPTNLVSLRPGKPTYLHGLSCAGAVGGGWGGGGDLYGTRSPLPLVVDQCALGCCGLLGFDEGLRWSTAPP